MGDPHQEQTPDQEPADTKPQAGEARRPPSPEPYPSNVSTPPPSPASKEPPSDGASRAPIPPPPASWTPPGDSSPGPDPRQSWDYRDRQAQGQPELPGQEENNQTQRPSRIPVWLLAGAVVLLAVALAIPLLFSGSAPAENPTEMVPPEFTEDVDPEEEERDLGPSPDLRPSQLTPTPSP